MRAEGAVDRFLRALRQEVTHVHNDGEEHRPLFPLDYLMGFINRVKDEELRIHLETDFPVRVDWDVATWGTWP